MPGPKREVVRPAEEVRFDLNAQQFWYPNLETKNSQNRGSYYLFAAGSPTGATHTKGNLIVDAGAHDSLGISADQPLVLHGNIINNGNLEFTTSQALFVGTVAQTVTGNAVTFKSSAPKLLFAR